MCWAGKNAPSTARTLIGATDPLSADLGTIRGDFGQARLVASLNGCEARILVSLSPVTNQDGDQINIECSLLVIDEEANILHQVL